MAPKRMAYELVEEIHGKSVVVAKFVLLSDATVAADALARAYENAYSVQDGAGTLLHESR